MGPTPPPRTIGPYELLDELGRGGMGRVVRARHKETGAVHALKLLDSLDVEARLRFAREGEALGALSGEGVVRVHGAGEERGQAWLAMDLLAGGTLRERLRTRGRLPWAEAARLVARLARALARCHARGVVHRDVKPENVLFDEAGAPQLADFGLVRAESAAALTRTGQALGTPSYMAPEQLDGERVGPPADVWSLGVLLAELVTGERPYLGASMTAVLGAIIAGHRRPWSAPDAPAELAAIVGRALAVEPGERLDAAGLADALEALAADDGRVERRDRRLTRTLGLVAAVAVLALGLAVAAQARRRQREGEAQAQADARLATEVRAAALRAGARDLDGALAVVSSWSALVRRGRLGLPPARDRAPLEAALAEVASRVVALRALGDPAPEEIPSLLARADRALALARADLAVARLDRAVAEVELRWLPADDPERRVLERALAPLGPGAGSASAAELAAIASAAAARGDARLSFEARWAASREVMWRERRVVPAAWVPPHTGPDLELGRAAMAELFAECLVLGPRTPTPSSTQGRPHPPGFRHAANLEALGAKDDLRAEGLGVGMARGLMLDAERSPATALEELTLLESVRPGLLAAACLGPRPLALAEASLAQDELTTAALGVGVAWAAAGDGPDGAEARAAATRLAARVRGQLRASLAGRAAPGEVAAHVLARLRLGELTDPVPLNPRPDAVCNELLLVSGCDWAGREPLARLLGSMWFARFQRANYDQGERDLFQGVLDQAAALAADGRRAPWERAAARLAASEVLLLLERVDEARAQLQAALPDAGDPDDVRQRLVITHLQRGLPGVEEGLSLITRGPWPGRGTDPRAIAWLRYGELVYDVRHVEVMQRYGDALDRIVPRLERIPEARGICRAIDDMLRRFRGR